MQIYIVELTNKYNKHDIKYKYFSSEKKRDAYVITANTDTRWLRTFTKPLDEE